MILHQNEAAIFIVLLVLLSMMTTVSSYAISFDFDDTLLHTDAIKYRTLLQVCQEAHPVLGPEVVKSVSFDAREAPKGTIITPETIFASVATGLMERGATPPKDNKDWGAAMTQRFLSILKTRIPNEAQEVAGATKMLEHLHRNGVPCYINTATPEELVELIIHKRGWHAYFRKTLGSTRSKEENLNFVIEAERLDPSHVIHVGDGENDCRAAFDCGCKFVGVRSKDAKRMQFNGPVHALVEDMHQAGTELSHLLEIPSPT